MNTLIILDWDDTLFPTAWIMAHKLNINDENVKNKYMIYFSQLDVILHKLLTKMLKMSIVVIVTNAKMTWINYSIECVPNTKKLIKNKIKVISARDKFYDSHKNKIYAWKILTFSYIVKYYKNLNTILSIGDAEYELVALLNLYKNRKNYDTYYKSIKLISKPSFDILLQQLNALYTTTIPLLKQNKNMDLSFVKI